MKNLFQIILIFSISAFTHAQSELILKFDHQLAGNKFALDQETTSPKGTKYKLSRLQYYLSGFKVVHDGGQVLELNQTYFLVDPSQQNSNELSLGLHTGIQKVEQIEFAIGVDAASNHLDPTTYSSDHPLAPKNPTMHWGWAAGYRFISFNGNSARNNGSFLDVLSIEGLGDANYKPKRYDVTGKTENDKIYIEFIAEYNRLLESINISGGANSHGETGIAATMVLNGSSLVFSPKTTTSVDDVNKDLNVEIHYSRREVSIKYNNLTKHDLELGVFDVSGKRVLTESVRDASGDILIPESWQSGTYIYNFTYSGKLLATGKFVIL